MLTVGDQFPEFELKAIVGPDLKTGMTTIRLGTYAGMWLVIFFWPKDFTFVCPTEISAFDKDHDAFKKCNAQILGASVDSEFVHLAWREHNKALKNLKFPMLADVKRELSQALGILDKKEGVSQRATFIVDPNHIIRFSMVTDLSTGRNTHEVLRVLKALQTNELCPCNWQEGEETIKV